MKPGLNIVAAAFCPQPPLLVPALAAGEAVAARAPAVAAVRWLCAQPVDHIVVLGAGGAAQVFPPGAAGRLAGFGVDVSPRLPGGPAPAADPLPLSLTVGAWLLGEVDCRSSAAGISCDQNGSVPCWPAAGEASPTATGLLVMGDGSARRTEKAPGWLDGRAADYDAGVSAALAAGDPASLALAANPPLGAQLLAAGAPAWLAASRLLSGGQWSAGVSYDEAPYGVGYLVATWSSRDEQ